MQGIVTHSCGALAAAGTSSPTPLLLLVGPTVAAIAAACELDPGGFTQALEAI
jgi:hypothetical protein